MPPLIELRKIPVQVTSLRVKCNAMLITVCQKLVCDVWNIRDFLGNTGNTVHFNPTWNPVAIAC